MAGYIRDSRLVVIFLPWVQNEAYRTASQKYRNWHRTSYPAKYKRRRVSLCLYVLYRRKLWLARVKIIQGFAALWACVDANIMATNPGIRIQTLNITTTTKKWTALSLSAISRFHSRARRVRTRSYFHSSFSVSFLEIIFMLSEDTDKTDLNNMCVRQLNYRRIYVKVDEPGLQDLLQS